MEEKAPAWSGGLVSGQGRFTSFGHRLAIQPRRHVASSRCTTLARACAAAEHDGRPGPDADPPLGVAIVATSLRVAIAHDPPLRVAIAHDPPLRAAVAHDPPSRVAIAHDARRRPLTL
jgi:hypothetical protein